METARPGASAATRLAEALADNRATPSVERERKIIDLRRATFQARPWPRPAHGTINEPPCIRQDTLPEITAAQLDARWLRDGIQGAGGLIVRGLLSGNEVEAARRYVDRAFEARREIAAGRSTTAHRRWYGRASTVTGKITQLGALGSDAERSTGSIWAVDSPPTAFRLCELYQALQLPTLLADYFGEAGVLSVKKWVLRKIPPDPGRQAGWHQDGRFLGDGIRTVNLWIALSDCGEGADAPGMQILGGREPRIHPTGTAGAMFDWVVGDGLVAELATDRPVLYPRFAPGDAVFFDHFNLHRTGAGPLDRRIRYALETWFFAASSAPAKQQPLVL